MEARGSDGKAEIEADVGRGPWLVLVDYGPGDPERYSMPQIAYSEHDIYVYSNAASHSTSESYVLLVISIPQALAAPDLLAAVREIVAEWDARNNEMLGDGGYVYTPGIKAARVAIAKAQP